MNTNSKLVVVTGGAGFIGTHLCKRLTLDGHRVISLDNYFTGSRENHIEGVEYREGHTKDIETLIPETPDIIYHLGEYSRVAKSLEEPDVVFDLNMTGTFAVAEFWRKRKCKLVYAGSSTKQVETRDDGVDGRDLSPYTWTKASNSDLVRNYGRWFNLSYSITYFYNVYGVGERAGEKEMGTFIETCKQAFLKGEKISIRLPGTQTRAFTHVLDTVEAIVLVGENGENSEYGVSAKEVYSLLDVAHLFGLEIEMLPQTRSSRSSGSVDTSELEKLGWKQEHTLQDYVAEVKAKK